MASSSKATYSSSVIPILLAIYCASWVQKACYKIIPETFRGLFTPITIIVIVPLTLPSSAPRYHRGRLARAGATRPSTTSRRSSPAR
ncbi:MAG: hypothetical protein ACLU0O_12830 [Collinsella sp.]